MAGVGTDQVATARPCFLSSSPCHSVLTRGKIVATRQSAVDGIEGFKECRWPYPIVFGSACAAVPARSAQCCRVSHAVSRAADQRNALEHQPPGFQAQPVPCRRPVYRGHRGGLRLPRVHEPRARGTVTSIRQPSQSQQGADPAGACAGVVCSHRRGARAGPPGRGGGQAGRPGEIAPGQRCGIRYTDPGTRRARCCRHPGLGGRRNPQHLGDPSNDPRQANATRRQPARRLVESERPPRSDAAQAWRSWRRRGKSSRQFE